LSSTDVLPPAEAYNLAVLTFQENRDPSGLLRARTTYADQIIAKEFAEVRDKFPVPVSLAAVGGYGRGELFPFSDIDLLILVASEAHVGQLKDPLADLLRRLWDAQLRVSHSVRTVAECCQLHEQNAELNISLLDIRFLDGEQTLFADLQRKLPEATKRYASELSRLLIALARQRHGKYNNTVYQLEPNVKEAPGGIRDLHVLRWLSQLSPGHQAIQEARTEVELEPDAVARQQGPVRSPKELLFQLRCFLHLEAGRDSNLFTFELQDEVARRLPDTPVPPKDWMRTYYRHARQLFNATQRALEYAESQDPSLIRQFRSWRSRLSSSEFTVSRERVYLRNAAETLSSPESALRLFSFVGRHGIRISWDTHRRVRLELEKLGKAFAAGQARWQSWAELFSQSHAAVALQDMLETGLLAVAIPQWEHVDGLVVRDFYHRYTVDEHTLVAIDSFDRLLAASEDSLLRFRNLAVDENDPASLRLSLLLHDIGKGREGGDHVTSSLEIARTVLENLHVPPDKQKAVLFLIGHHLDLSLIMNGRDLEDAATARFLTSRVETQEDLRRLTLLTFSDTSAVNPTAMSPWRLEQLWRVYSLGAEQLTRELASDKVSSESESALGDLPRDLLPFVTGFPKRYVRTHSTAEIAHHRSLEQSSRREGVAVEIGREAGAYSMTVLAHDKPGLFAALCGTLASFGLNIVRGEAASNSAGCVLDIMRFTDPHRTLELNPAEANRLQWTVECVVRGSVQVDDLLKRRRPAPRPTREASIAPSVQFDNEASDSATLIEFVGEDRPGLMYDLASAITRVGCNIEVVMIDTEAHKAADVLYVTREGHKLDDEMQERLCANLLKAAVYDPARSERGAGNS
jgi:[protein-PII] uridylyltransferase